jgi:hypothetical protein
MADNFLLPETKIEVIGHRVGKSNGRGEVLEGIRAIEVTIRVELPVSCPIPEQLCGTAPFNR